MAQAVPSPFSCSQPYLELAIGQSRLSQRFASSMLSPVHLAVVYLMDTACLIFCLWVGLLGLLGDWLSDNLFWITDLSALQPVLILLLSSFREVTACTGPTALSSWYLLPLLSSILVMLPSCWGRYQLHGGTWTKQGFEKINLRRTCICTSSWKFYSSPGTSDKVQACGNKKEEIDDRDAMNKELSRFPSQESLNS